MMTTNLPNKPTTETLIVNLPDAHVDLSPMPTISNAGAYEQATLDFFTDTLMPTWLEKQFSLHQLAEFLADKAELWTAPSVKLVKVSMQEPFAFWIKFNDQVRTTFLVQCELTSRAKVH